MLKNYMTLKLGGQVRGLKFNIGTLKCLRDITGIDPLAYKAESDTFQDLLPYATKIMHAALLSNCLSKKEQPDFRDEDVSVWVDELSVAELTEVIAHYNSIFTTKLSANGEVGKDTQIVNI
jgi:hypothetical protein